MEISFELYFGPHKGFGIERGRWENQHGCGVFFALKAGIVRFEFSVGRWFVRKVRS